MASTLSYPIAHSGSDKIIFARKWDGCMTILFVVGGGAISLFAFFMLGGEDDFSWVIAYGLLFLFGIGFAAGSFMLPLIQHENTPASITFKQDEKMVMIEMRNRENAHIPYSEIIGFEIIQEKRSAAAANSAGIHYIHYHVILKRKNGGTWFLTSSTDKQEAEQVLAMLRASVIVDDVPKPLPTVHLPPMFKIESGNPINVQWMNPTPTWVILGLRLAVAASVLALIRLLLDLGDVSWTSSAIFIVLFSLFLLPFLLLIKKVRDQSKIKQSLSIGLENLEYNEVDTTNGKTASQKTIKLSSIAQIVYSYSGMDKARNSTLAIQHLPNEAEGKEKTPVNLFVSGLNPVECLQLEGWLRETILARKVI
jgi:hypothetical protein